MHKHNETAGLLVNAQKAFIALDLLHFKNDEDRQNAKEQVKASMFKVQSTHATQTYGVNTVSVENGMAYIHLGLWSAHKAQILSEKLIGHGIAHSITWNDPVTRTQGGHHYRFNNLGDLTYRKTTQTGDCAIDGLTLQHFAQYASKHGAEALQQYIVEMVESNTEPSWDNQSLNGDVYLAKYRKIIDQNSANDWKIVNCVHNSQFGFKPNHNIDQVALDSIKASDRLIIFVEGEQEFTVRVEVLHVDADGIIEAELKSESWANDYNSVGDRFFLTKDHVSAISPR